MKNSNFDPSHYWANLISGDLDLSRVGHPELGAYNRVAYRVRLHALDRVLRALSVDMRRTRVFEAAFGVGFYLAEWARRGALAVSGLDISPDAVKAAQARFPSFKLRQADLGVDGAASGQSDLVLAIDVLYHIVDDARWQVALANLANVVARDGHLVLTDKFPDNPSHTDPFPHVRRRSLQTYDDTLRRLGFERVMIQPVFVFMDDPLEDGCHPLLGKAANLQWRVGTKIIRTLAPARRLRDGLGLSFGLCQLPFELLALSFLDRSPNLELAVYRRTPAHRE